MNRPEIGLRNIGRSTANNNSPNGNIHSPKIGKKENTPPKLKINASGTRTKRQPSRRSMVNGRRKAGNRRDSTSNCL